MIYIRCAIDSCEVSRLFYPVNVDQAIDARGMMIPFYRPLDLRCAHCGAEPRTYTQDEALWEQGQGHGTIQPHRVPTINIITGRTHGELSDAS